MTWPLSRRRYCCKLWVLGSLAPSALGGGEAGLAVWGALSCGLAKTVV